MRKNITSVNNIPLYQKHADFLEVDTLISEIGKVDRSRNIPLYQMKVSWRTETSGNNFWFLGSI